MMPLPIGRVSPSTPPSSTYQAEGVNVTFQAVAKHYVDGEIREFIERCVNGTPAAQLMQFQNLPSDDLRRAIYDSFRRKTGKTTICEMAYEGRLYQVQIEHKDGREGIEMTFKGRKPPDPAPMSTM